MMKRRELVADLGRAGDVLVTLHAREHGPHPISSVRARCGEIVRNYALLYMRARDVAGYFPGRVVGECSRCLA